LVAEETAMRVRQAAEELSYQPHPVASALATGRTGVVGLWMRNVHRPFFAELMRHVSEHSRIRNVNLIIIEQGHGIETEECFAPTGTQWPVDGIIAHEPPGVIHGRPTGAWPKSPVVTISEGPFVGSDTVHFDLYSGTRSAVEHLVQQGCRRIGYLAQELVHQQGRTRMLAYTDVMRECALDTTLISTGAAQDTYETGRAAVMEHSDVVRCLDGLFCHNDELAIGAMSALRELGITVPDDLAVVGCDGIAVAPYVEPPLTTIRLPIAEVVAHSFELLFGRFDHPQAPHATVELPTKLVVRKSSSRKGPTLQQEDML